jgi:hypothetical protein
MPEFVLNRTHTLRSLQGHIINFEKGKPTWVPPVCVKEALEIGADPVESVDKTNVLLGDDPNAKPKAPELTAEERAAKIKDAFAQLERENNRADFAASGAPKPVAIARITGFTPENRERDEVWRAYKEAKALGSDD